MTTVEASVKYPLTRIIRSADQSRYYPQIIMLRSFEENHLFLMFQTNLIIR